MELRRIAARARWQIGAPVALATLLVAATPAAAVTYPSSIASTGDSITMAYNTGLFPYTDNPSASWSTGTNSTVVSLYSRLLAVNPAISGRKWNDAKSGAKIGDLAGQMNAVVSQHPDAVTVLMGGNDVCASSESAMTSTADFEARFRSAMTTLAAGSPNTKVYLASVPNVYQLWSLFKGNSTARSVWSLFKVCQSMLANPTSTLQADVDRRARVLQRDKDYNAILAKVCAEYATCRWDGNAVFNTVFTTSDVTTRDYFHPSIAGQKKLASITWTAFFGS